MLSLVLIPVSIIFAIYWIIKLNKLGYKGHLLYYIFFCLLGFYFSAFCFAFDFLENARRVGIAQERFGSLEEIANPEFLFIIMSVLVFLIFLSILLFVLDVKEYSPMYEQQYLEENKSAEIGNAENN